MNAGSKTRLLVIVFMAGFLCKSFLYSHSQFTNSSSIVQEMNQYKAGRTANHATLAQENLFDNIDETKFFKSTRRYEHLNVAKTELGPITPVFSLIRKVQSPVTDELPPISAELDNPSQPPA